MVWIIVFAMLIAVSVWGVRRCRQIDLERSQRNTMDWSFLNPDDGQTKPININTSSPGRRAAAHVASKPNEPGWLAKTASAAILVLLIGSCATTCTTAVNKQAQSNARNWQANDQSAYAIVAAQNAVRERLLTPSVAKFPWTGTEIATRSGSQNQTYTVSSYVDTQNGFGAMVRVRYAATLTCIGYEVGGGAQFRIEDVQLLDPFGR